MAQLKWHKEIKAWADGAQIQVDLISDPGWSSIDRPNWTTDEDVKFRVKPINPRTTIDDTCCWAAVELTPEVIEALKVANIEY